MTTEITISTKNGNKAVEVEIINVTAAGPTTERTLTLKPGDTSEAITLHDTRRVMVREVGDFIDKPAEPEKPAPVAPKADAKAKVPA